VGVFFVFVQADSKLVVASSVSFTPANTISIAWPELHLEAFRNDGFGDAARRDIVFHEMPAPVVVLFAVVFEGAA
jgi:hypothetical protein